jgi:hypothetical protein
MKNMLKIFRHSAALALFVATIETVCAAPPALSIHQAVDLARNSLHERGLEGDVYVVAATLEAENMTRSKSHWYVRWSRSIPREDRKQEIGLQINMDGSVIHLIKAPPHAQGRKPNQASILDLRGH